MIGIFLLAQEDIGFGLIRAAEKTYNKHIVQLEALTVDCDRRPEQTADEIERKIEKLDQGDGVLILADVYGASHTNMACRFLQRGRIELIAGVNLPMLLRVLNYRNLKMDDLIDKALGGGCGGIVCAANPSKLTGEAGS
jgi:PTS system ascorbate-specific IIA component